MTVSTQERSSASRLIIALTVIAGLIMATIVAVTPVFATHTGPLVTPTPTGQSTNFDCADLVEEGFIDSYDDQDKSGDSPSGNGSDEHVSWNVTGSVVSFQADAGWLVAAVNVKGGQQGGNVYVYDGFPGGGVDHDNGLVTPNNPNGQPAGVSHLVFCLVEHESPPEVNLQLVPCAPGQQTAPRIRVVALVLLGLHLFLDGSNVETVLDGNGEAAVPPGVHTWSVEKDEVELASGDINVAPCTTGSTPEGSELGGTGSPAASLQNSAMSALGFSGPLATLLFGAILLSSLGALAYANVRATRSRR